MKNHPSIFIALMAKRIWDPNYNRQKFIFSKTFWKHLKIVPSNANAVGHYRSLVRTGLTRDKRLQRKLKMHRILNNKDNAIRPCDRVCIVSTSWTIGWYSGDNCHFIFGNMFVPTHLIFIVLKTQWMYPLHSSLKTHFQ